MNTEIEEWRPVPDYEGAYEVSDQGRVRSLPREVHDGRNRPRRLKGKIMKPLTQTAGYQQVHLQANGRHWSPLVHRLVLQVFIGEAPPGTEACHQNGNPHDNRVTNLRWDTRLANVGDAIGHGTHRGSRTHCPKGHPYEGANLIVRPNGSRGCRACARLLGHAKSRGPLPQVRCDECRSPIERPARGRPPKWCSDACRTAGKRAQAAARLQRTKDTPSPTVPAATNTRQAQSWASREEPAWLDR